MSLLGRLRQVRLLLISVLTTRAVLLGWTLTLVAILATVLLDVTAGLSAEMRRGLTTGALLVGIVAILVQLWRARTALQLQRVALWVEEREPSLQYALVTAVEQPSPASSAAPSELRDVRWGAVMRRAAWRALAVPALALASALAALAMVPDVMIARVQSPRVGDAVDRIALPGTRKSALSPVIVTITPPAYTGEAQRVLEDPVAIPGLAGSRVSIRGSLPEGAVVTAMLGDTAHAVTASGSRWTLNLAMPTRAMVLRLRDPASERIITVEPRIDRPPVVTLTTPLRDTVFREAVGVLPLAADVTDDIGIASASFELIVSSGEGESFTFRSRLLAATSPARGQKALSLRDSIVFGALDLKPGDILHLRAVARDANNVSGPGLGASETRTLRIARKDEYDTVAVEGAPPPNPEEGIISQRMLILLAEALEKRRPRLGRPVVLSESRAIGRDQRKLRKRVGEIIFTRLGDESHSHDEEEDDTEGLTPEQMLAAADAATNAGHATDFAEGESPVVAINKPLLEAYNAMWDATRELDAGEPGRALPPMRAALAAIQRARNAERMYLRGRSPQVVVDLAKVRLQGKERGDASARSPRSVDPNPARQLSKRLSAILAGANLRQPAIIDSLLVLRVDALTDSPAFASALAQAIEALRGGTDATSALIRARRTLEPREAVSLSTPLWAGW